MKNLIKYEKLSHDLKKEIHRYHEIHIHDEAESTLEDSMVKWFHSEFDNWLLHNFQTKSTDKRKHFRLDVELPIKVLDTLVSSANDDQQAFDLIGRVINISRGGMYFRYHKHLEISSIVKVMVDLKDADKDLENIEALAMVVRADKLGEEVYGLGIMFSSIYESARHNIDFFILKNLSHYLYQ